MAQRSRDHRAYAGLNPAQGPPAATYQTRVSGYVGLDREAGDAALAAYAELYGQVERKLFADVAAGRSAAPLKSDYIREHGIPARMFSALGQGTGVAGRQGVGGAGGAAVAGGQLGAANCSSGTAGCAGSRNRVGGSRFTRSGVGLANLRSRLAGLETDIGAGRVSGCASGRSGCGVSGTTWRPTANV